MPYNPLPSASLSQQSAAPSTPMTTSSNPRILQINDLSFSIPRSRRSKKERQNGRKIILDHVTLEARSGRLTALVGPSGSGKSTLLEVLSGRKGLEGGSIWLDGRELGREELKSVSSLVEQEDHFLPTLTVKETISFSLHLSHPDTTPSFRSSRVDSVISSLGLQAVRDQRIGDSLRRGISGGEKRRVGIACGLVGFPRVLFLDEPTSGLDSTTAKEMIHTLSRFATTHGTIIITSIHQPGYSTWNLFDSCVLLSSGKVCYEGETGGLEGFLKLIGVEVDRHVLPIDAAMDIVNSNFNTPPTSSSSVSSRPSSYTSINPVNADIMRNLHTARRTTSALIDDTESIKSMGMGKDESDFDSREEMVRQEEGNTVRVLIRQTIILSHRTALNYSRNLLAYGMRFAMYGGMAVMMSVIWVRLGYKASTINDRLSVHFYAVAFLSFMSVAGIPSFLEERALFKKERANGLYGPLPFLLANTLVNLPFLFGCSVFFTIIAYWGIGLHPGATPFFRYLGFLFLAIITAETQSVLVSGLIPIFVAALAVAAFLNGFWMSLGGYFIKYISLPHFWKVSFHWMDYQTYAFALLTNSDLNGLVFDCDKQTCPYPSTMGSSQISGQDVLNALDMDDISYGKYAGILISIFVIYRIMLYLTLRYL